MPVSLLDIKNKSTRTRTSHCNILGKYCTTEGPKEQSLHCKVSLLDIKNKSARTSNHTPRNYYIVPRGATLALQCHGQAWRTIRISYSMYVVYLGACQSRTPCLNAIGYIPKPMCSLTPELERRSRDKRMRKSWCQNSSKGKSTCSHSQKMIKVNCHTKALPVQGWDDLAHSLGSTGGGWDNVLASSASIAPFLQTTNDQGRVRQVRHTANGEQTQEGCAQLSHELAEDWLQTSKLLRVHHILKSSIRYFDLKTEVLKNKKLAKSWCIYSLVSRRWETSTGTVPGLTLHR